MGLYAGVVGGGDEPDYYLIVDPQVKKGLSYYQAFVLAAGKVDADLPTRREVAIFRANIRMDLGGSMFALTSETYCGEVSAMVRVVRWADGREVADTPTRCSSDAIFVLRVPVQSVADVARQVVFDSAKHARAVLDLAKSMGCDDVF
jgi:hypothetical protein